MHFNRALMDQTALSLLGFLAARTKPRKNGIFRAGVRTGLAHFYALRYIEHAVPLTIALIIKHDVLISYCITVFSSCLCYIFIL